ncbi:MAG: TetR/AcrR family transcriptional regulator [Pirellulaceae bacterium]
MPRLSKARRELLNTMMKDTIFEATSSVLCQHGVDGTTMNRVAEAANLAKSSLYDYFPSKDELLAFVADRIMVPAAQHLEEVALLDLPATEKLREIVRNAFTRVESHRAMLVLLLRDDFRDVAESSKLPLRSRMVQALSGIFEQGMTEGQFRRENASEVSRLFMACVGEFCEMSLAADRREEIEDRVEKLLRLFLYGISTSAANGGPTWSDR